MSSRDGGTLHAVPVRSVGLDEESLELDVLRRVQKDFLRPLPLRPGSTEDGHARFLRYEARVVGEKTTSQHVPAHLKRRERERERERERCA